LGTVAIGYYEQNKLDKLFDLDPDEEFVVLLAPVGRYKQEKKLAEFFKFPKKAVDPKSLRKLEGKYKRNNLVEFIVKNGELAVRIEDFEEVLEPYNEVEFIGEVTSRALRFEFSKDGRPEKVVALTSNDEEIELEYVE
jgi:hypothetical protein